MVTQCQWFYVKKIIVVWLKTVVPSRKTYGKHHMLYYAIIGRQKIEKNKTMHFFSKLKKCIFHPSDALFDSYWIFQMLKRDHIYLSRRPRVYAIFEEKPFLHI